MTGYSGLGWPWVNRFSPMAYMVSCWESVALVGNLCFVVENLWCLVGFVWFLVGNLRFLVGHLLGLGVLIFFH